MAKVKIISQAVVQQVITRSMAYNAIRQAFESLASHSASVQKVAFGGGFNSSESYGVKMGADAGNHNLGLKIGSYWPGNSVLGLPAHGSTVILLDPATGFPEAIVGAAYMNGYRTAAADALAVNYLARADAGVLGVIGAGHQAEHEIRAIAEVRKLQRVRVFTRTPERAAWLAAELDDFPVPLEFTTAEAAVRESDIVVTVTPSKRAIVAAGWLRPGTHVSAMGADSKGKQELAPEILQSARLFADYPEQAVDIGEFQHVLPSAGVDPLQRITALGKVTRGEAPGRQGDEEITVFDSSGTAIQDLSMARAVLDEALRRGLCTEVDL
jgi:ornithine cyclodeaminase/alanine dehydrogenase-like protein (mu-crystallin family)